MTGKKTIYDILAQREEFLVIGLTGRMGSGCTSVAKLLESPFDNLHFPSPTPQPGMESLSEEERTVRIIQQTIKLKRRPPRSLFLCIF